MLRCCETCETRCADADIRIVRIEGRLPRSELRGCAKTRDPIYEDYIGRLLLYITTTCLLSIAVCIIYMKNAVEARPARLTMANEESLLGRSLVG